MYKKQRPKLSVSAVISSAQNPISANWFGNGSISGLPNTNDAPSTRKL